LKLKVNEEKSGVGRPWERKFLGFTFTVQEQCRRRIAPASLKRVKNKIRAMTSRNRGRRLEQIIEELTIYLRGWLNYFDFCETPTVLRRALATKYLHADEQKLHLFSAYACVNEI
jgi:RNA-directed DNA polymerase